MRRHERRNQNQISIDDPASFNKMIEFITLWRTVLAPVLNADIDNIAKNQCTLISAAGFFAGLTAGHMIVMGTMHEGDKRKAGDVLLQCFRQGIKFGKNEAETAVARQAAGETRQ